MINNISITFYRLIKDKLVIGNFLVNMKLLQVPNFNYFITHYNYYNNK